MDLVSDYLPALDETRLPIGGTSVIGLSREAAARWKSDALSQQRSADAEIDAAAATARAALEPGVQALRDQLRKAEAQLVEDGKEVNRLDALIADLSAKGDSGVEARQQRDEAQRRGRALAGFRDEVIKRLVAATDAQEEAGVAAASRQAAVVAVRLREEIAAAKAALLEAMAEPWRAAFIRNAALTFAARRATRPADKALMQAQAARPTDDASPLRPFAQPRPVATDSSPQVSNLDDR